MAKDPAFLFYPNDYIGGTMGMTFEEKGAYVDLLMLQFNRGHMTDRMARQVVGQIWDTIKDKFQVDDGGRYFNARLQEEKEKRQNFTHSRRNNLSGNNQHSKKDQPDEGHTTSRMENGNEDENNNVNQIDLVSVIGKLENSFNVFWNAYDKKRGLDWARDVWFGKIKLKTGKLLSDKDRRDILKHVPKYVASTPNKQKRKDPKSYLNNRAWLDEIIEDTETSWPRQWSKEYESTLQPKQLQAWRKFLRDKCGLLPVTDGRKRVIMWVPKEERDQKQHDLRQHG